MAGGSPWLLRLVIGGAAIASALALWMEVGHLRAKVFWFRAQSAADAGRGDETIGLCDRAMAADPSLVQAVYLRAARLKDAGRWGDIEAVIPGIKAGFPNQASAARLAAEASLRAGRAAEGLEDLKLALRINPWPPTGPSGFWRIMMITAAGRGDKKWALAAAFRAVEFTSDDPILGGRDRAAIMNDAAAWLQRAGLNRTAAHLQNAARNLPAG